MTTLQPILHHSSATSSLFQTPTTSHTHAGEQHQRLDVCLVTKVDFLVRFFQLTNRFHSFLGSKHLTTVLAPRTPSHVRPSHCSQHLLSLNDTMTIYRKRATGNNGESDDDKLHVRTQFANNANIISTARYVTTTHYPLAPSCN